MPSFSDTAQSLLLSGRLDEALSAFEAALALQPDDVTARFGRANALKHLGRLSEARAEYDAVLAKMPDAPGARNNRGEVLLALGQPAAALGDFERAIVKNPNMAPAHLGRGIARQRIGRAQESLDDFTRTLQLWPDCADAFFHRALSLEMLGRMDDAVAAYGHVLALQPNSIASLNNRGTALAGLRRFADAAADFHTIAALMPGSAAALNGLAVAAAHACDWSEDFRDRLAAAIRAGKAEIQPGTLLAYSNDPGLMRTCAENFLRALPHAAQPLWRHTPFSGKKIRLAYCSADFHSHATARLMVELLERHDRSRFEVIGICFGPDDASAMRRRVMKAFDQFHAVRGKSDGEIAALIAGLEIDIAVDLKGLTAGARTGIFALRPAPVQVNYLGYPGTMGAEFMDTIIADPVVLPLSEQKFYSEKIVQLPDCYQANDSKREFPPAHSSNVEGRAEAGLPPSGFVFCCFNNSWKINAALFDIWARLLKAVPDSVLWLIEDSAEAAANLRRNAAARGLSAEKLVFAPRTDPAAHLARHRLADLFLDTLPYNAHTTASDALWVGVPVVTCRGHGFPGRVAASLVTAMGMPECITENLADYESLALALATDPPRLAALKAKLQAARATAPLFDTARFTRAIEAAYDRLRDDFLKG